MLSASIETVAYAAFYGFHETIKDVYFAGTQENWNTVVGDVTSVDNYNFPLDSNYTNATYHFAPDASGTLDSRFGWWFKDSELTFINAGVLAEGETVMTATYSADGRMTGLQLLNPASPTQNVADGYGSVKMMLLGSGLAPAAEAAGFEAP
jgi:hypothetical protein